MAWNTSFTRFYSTDLANLECGSSIRIPRRDRLITKVAVYDGDLEKGQCVNMIRVPKDSRILHVDLSWASSTGIVTAILGVGDPYACARFLGPISTVVNRGYQADTAATPGAGHCTAWGVTCGTMTKVGRVGDGCGRFYQYTCETDIQIINLHSAGDAANGGWFGGAIGANTGMLGTKWTGGRLVLTVGYLDAS